MAVKRKPENVSAETDMTPMIDMTFQLIAFFMFVLNFGEGEQDARIKLPSSVLAKPPEAALESAVVLQLTRAGQVIYAGDEHPLADMGDILLREKQAMERLEKRVADATVVVRADAKARTGKVQELIQICQENGFEKFSLRVMQAHPDTPPGT